MRRTFGPAADFFVASMAEITQQLISPIPGSRFLRRDGACAMVTGIPAPPVNGVWTERHDPDMAGVAALLDAVAGTGVPYGLRLTSPRSPNLPTSPSGNLPQNRHRGPLVSGRPGSESPWTRSCGRPARICCA